MNPGIKKISEKKSKETAGPSLPLLVLQRSVLAVHCVFHRTSPEFPTDKVSCPGLDKHGSNPGKRNNLFEI